MDRWMNGWIDGWMDGQMDGWMNTLKSKGKVSIRNRAKLEPDVPLTKRLKKKKKRPDI